MEPRRADGAGGTDATPAAAPAPMAPAPVATPATGSTNGSGASAGAAPDEEPSSGVYVDEVQSLLEKSLPARLKVVIRGSLADGCTRLQDPTVSRQRRTFHIALTATRDRGKHCTQALVPFELAVPVSITGLASGTYTVEAGGKTDTFTLQQELGRAARLAPAPRGRLALA